MARGHQAVLLPTALCAWPGGARLHVRGHRPKQAHRACRTCSYPRPCPPSGALGPLLGTLQGLEARGTHHSPAARALLCGPLACAVRTQDWESALPPQASLHCCHCCHHLLTRVPGGQLVSPLQPSPPLQDPRGAPTSLRNPTPFSTHNPPLSGAGSYGVDKMSPELPRIRFLQAPETTCLTPILQMGKLRSRRDSLARPLPVHTVNLQDLPLAEKGRGLPPSSYFHISPWLLASPGRAGPFPWVATGTEGSGREPSSPVPILPS